MTFDIIKAVILGIVEGLTEFLPVSSTGHLLLVQRFFGFADEDFGKTFAVLIQFGAHSQAHRTTPHRDDER